jgi:hypothetical protein
VVSPIAETTTTTSLLFGLDDAFGDPADPFGVGHRGSAVLLHDERHVDPFQPFFGPGSSLGIARLRSTTEYVD